MAGTDRGGSLRKLRYLLWALVVVALGIVGWTQVVSPRLTQLSDTGTPPWGAATIACRPPTAANSARRR